MKQLCVLFCALFFIGGCAADQWAEFNKDLRGDNMKMKSDFSALK